VTTDSLPGSEAAGQIAQIFASRAFLDSFNDGLVVQDLDGRIIDANVAASELLGVTRDQMLGRTSFDPRWSAIKEDGTPFPGDEHPASVTLRTHQPCLGMVMGVSAPERGLTWISIDTYPIVINSQLVGVSSLFTDVSSAVQTRRELRVTTDHLRIVAQYPADVVVLASHDAIGEWCSDSVTELMGWLPEEVVGQRIDSFMHPDDVMNIVNYRGSAPEATTASFEVRLRCKDESYRWISVSSRRFTDPVTHESRIVSSWRDAQSLVEAQQELESSEARFRFLAENASDIVAEIDGNFHIKWVSPAVFDVLGWRPEEIVGRSTIDIVFAEDLPAFLYERANVVSGMRPGSMKLRLLTSSGSSRWMMGRTRVKLDSGGVPTSFIVSLRDIHDEEMFRAELEATNERYRLLAENASDLIILTDADGEFRWVSPSSSESFGWRPEEMIGKGAQDFIQPEDYATILERREGGDQEVFSIESVRFRHADGGFRWVSGRGRNVRSAFGEVTNRIVAVRDVTDRVVAEQELARSEALFRLVLENQLDVTARLNLEGIVEWITPSVLNLTGRRPDEVVGHSINEFIYAADIPRLVLERGQVSARGAGHLEARILTVAGEEKWVAANVKPLLDEFGQTTGSVINVRDISDDHATRTQLAHSEKLFRLAMESAPVGMAVLDLERHFQAVNPVLCDMVGRSQPWLLEHGIADVLDPDDIQLDLRMRTEALSGHANHAGRQKRLLRSDGTTIWVEHAIGLLRDESDEPLSFVSTFVDVTESRAIQEKLRFQATHDALTQLVNRRDLYLRAESLQHHTARTGEHVGVLYIDIDGFKVVNDTFGHYVGDVILKAAAERLAASGRRDDVVARVGGDEFVILLSALHTVDDAFAVAQEIVENFREPFTSDGESITLGVSVGVALALPDETADDTLRRADAALYEAKVRGRGQAVRWSPEFA
jgi:diguanylate cyclase (GGDEF)-like protein/PAS domain S-box-containing protein